MACSLNLDGAAAHVLYCMPFFSINFFLSKITTKFSDGQTDYFNGVFL